MLRFVHGEAFPNSPGGQNLTVLSGVVRSGSNSPQYVIQFFIKRQSFPRPPKQLHRGMRIAFKETFLP